MKLCNVVKLLCALAPQIGMNPPIVPSKIEMKRELQLLTRVFMIPDRRSIDLTPYQWNDPRKNRQKFGKLFRS